LFKIYFAKKINGRYALLHEKRPFKAHGIGSKWRRCVDNSNTTMLQKS